MGWWGLAPGAERCCGRWGLRQVTDRRERLPAVGQQGQHGSQPAPGLQLLILAAPIHAPLPESAPCSLHTPPTVRLLSTRRLRRPSISAAITSPSSRRNPFRPPAAPVRACRLGWMRPVPGRSSTIASLLGRHRALAQTLSQLAISSLPPRHRLFPWHTASRPLPSLSQSCQ